MIVLLCVSALTALLYVYADEVKAAVLRELNKHLRSEVLIDPANIDITLIKTFPDCSVEFKKLLMMEALPRKKRDTLIFAEKLNLHFNIKDLWNKHYNIETISLQGGVAKPRIFKDGSNNYTFWDNKGPTTESQVNFKLKSVRLKDFRMVYHDQASKFKTDFRINKLGLHGDFSNKRYELASDGEFFLAEIVSGQHNFLRQKNLAFDINLLADGNRYTFSKSRVSLNRLGIALDGFFVYGDSLENADVKYKANDLDIASLLSLLPEAYKNKINDYESEGNFYASGRFVYKGRKAYVLESAFGVKEASIRYNPGNAEANHVMLEGKFRMDQKSGYLELKNISLNLASDSINGNLTLKDFSDPFLELSVKAGIHLENLHSFWPIDTLSSLKGRVLVNGSVRSKISDLKAATFSDKVFLDLEAKVSGIEAQFKHDPKVYKIAHCELRARERNIEVMDLLMNRGSSDLLVNGRMPGVFNHLLDRKAPLVIEGSLKSNRLNIEDFIGERQENSAANTNALIPANVHFKLQAQIEKFSFGKFNASDIRGELEIKNQKAIISDMHFTAVGGEAELDAFADNSGKKLDVMIQGKLNRINISQLFAEMNNFGQLTLTDNHLKGLVTADVDFSGTWNNNLESDPSSIRTNCNLLIERGELIDFKPLLSLSRFVKVEDLKRIRFSTLQSEIRIAEQVISIPRTTIKNSALNLELWGTHSFSNKIDYHFQLLLSELLAKRRKQTDDEFGPVENDPENRRSAFILMTGTVDEPVIKYDKQGFREKVKQDIKQEKQNLKQIIKEEISSIRNEPAAKAPKESPQVLQIEKPVDKTAPKKTIELKKREEDDEDF